jgi:ankyrin repeat protein
VVRILLEAGEMKDEDQKTCLHLAAEQGRSDVVQVLLEWLKTMGLVRVSLAATDKYGKTCLHLAA